MLDLYVLCAVVLAVAGDHVLWSASNGYQWDGWVYRTEVNATGMPGETSRMEFTQFVRDFGVSKTELFWSWYDSSSTSMWIGRALHDGGNANAKWLHLNGSVYGGLTYGFIDFSEDFNAIIYQDQWTYDLIMVNLDTSEPTRLGNFRYQGNGGMNGPLWLNGSTGYFGIDYSEANNNVCTNGGVLAVNVINGNSSTALAVYCDFSVAQFPRTISGARKSSKLILGTFRDVEPALFLYDLATTQRWPLTEAAGLQASLYKASWSSDETKIFFSGNGVNGNTGCIFFLNLNQHNNGSLNFDLWLPTPSGICAACIDDVFFVETSTPVNISLVSPSTSSWDGNVPVYIVGNGFQNTTMLSCLFGNTKVFGVLVAPLIVMCRSPKSPVSGETEVRVSNDGITWSNGLPFEFTA